MSNNTYTKEGILPMLTLGFTCSFRLQDGESSWNPTTTSGRRIHGPCIVRYTRHADGGIDTQVIRPEDTKEGED